EICLRLLSDPAIAQEAIPVIFGDAEVLRRAALATGLPEPKRIVAKDRLADLTEPAVVDFQALALEGFQPGVINAATGAAAYAYVEAAITAALAGEVAAVTTAPLNKEALALAGIHFPGHTEIFASRTNAERACM